MPPERWCGYALAKRFEADEPHEFVHFVAFLVQHSARDEAGLDVAADGQPREKVRVLKNEAALRARAGDPFRPIQQFAGLRNVEAGDQAQQRGLAATARADDRDQFAGRDGKRYARRGRASLRPVPWLVGRGKLRSRHDVVSAEPSAAARVRESSPLDHSFLPDQHAVAHLEQDGHDGREERRHDDQAPRKLFRIRPSLAPS